MRLLRRSDVCDDGAMNRRWDADEVGRGVASGEAFVGHVRELAELMLDDGWTTEDPEAHLLPHLRDACAQRDAEFQITDARSEGEIYVVDLAPTQPGRSIGALRRAVVALVATIAEESTHVRQRREADTLEFDMATGSTRDTPFVPHGHLVRVRILPAE